MPATPTSLPPDRIFLSENPLKKSKVFFWRGNPALAKEKCQWRCPKRALDLAVLSASFRGHHRIRTREAVINQHMLLKEELLRRWSFEGIMPQ